MENRKKNIQELNRVDVDAYKAKKKMPVWVVLNDIRSMNNVGSTFRSSDAFLVEKIILGGISAQPPHREIHKTALGAENSVAWEYHSDLGEFLKWHQQNGSIIASVEQCFGSVDPKSFVDDFQFDKPLLLVFGNEVNGVHDEVIKLSDFLIEIPQGGTKHSLNISVSVGVLLYKLFEKWNLLHNK